jgi:hypothetical protein
VTNELFSAALEPESIGIPGDMLHLQSKVLVAPASRDRLRWPLTFLPWHERRSPSQKVADFDHFIEKVSVLP